MIRIFESTSSDLSYIFGGMAPVLHIAPGEVWQTRTEDYFSGGFSGTQMPESLLQGAQAVNPVTGPIYVEGSDAGDLLAVHLVDLVPARSLGTSSTFRQPDDLERAGPVLFDKSVWSYRIDVSAEGVIREDNGAPCRPTLPLEPMLGTVGVAPGEPEVVSTIMSSRHGGNMGTRSVRAGNTLYLPVFQPGALLAFGGGRARKGDGTPAGLSVEIAVDATFVVAVLKRSSTALPRIESHTTIESVGSGRTLDDAINASLEDMNKWVCDLTGLIPSDAYQLLAQACKIEVAGRDNPTATAVTSLNKGFLCGALPYGEAHERLRNLATLSKVEGVKASSLADSHNKPCRKEV